MLWVKGGRQGQVKEGGRQEEKHEMQLFQLSAQASEAIISYLDFTSKDLR